MKAKVKANGRIIEVEKAMIGYAECAAFNIEGFPMQNFYSEAELEFLPDAPEEVTIEGWVAIDDGGGCYLHTQRPRAVNREFCDTGEYDKEWLCQGKMYELDRRLFPEMTSESEPKRVKLTITPIEE